MLKSIIGLRRRAVVPGLPDGYFASALGIATKVEGPEYEQLYHAGEEGGWTHANPKR